MGGRNMINFYQTWKDEKDSEPKRKKNRGQFECIICKKRVNGLKEHMEDVHGKGTYHKFLKAEQMINEQRRMQLLELMEL
jgi:hypothetical protein